MQSNLNALKENSPLDEDKLPPVLYKYRFWNDSEECKFHRRLLTHREIYFAKPSSFNDPFDFQIIPIRSSAKETRQYLSERIHKVFPNLSSSERARIIRGRTLVLRDPQKFRKELRENSDKSYGVFSLSADSGNLIMWAHYADCHKGICIGFPIKVLEEFYVNLFKNLTVKKPKFWCDLLEVDYLEKYPEYKLVSQSHKPGSWNNARVQTKSVHWEAEQEYRLIMGDYPELGDEVRKQVLPHDAIKTVILGCRMERKHKDEIRKLLRERGYPEGIVVEAKQSDDKFELEIPEIA